MSLLEDYDYELPPERIAQQGVEPRDASRLMVLDRQGHLEHAHFYDLPRYLQPGDLLVLNESKVIPARLWARKPTGGRIEILLLLEREPGLWEALLRPARRVPLGGELILDEGLTARVESIEPDGSRRLRFSGDLWPHLERLGSVPLPPYIHGSVDPERYQTVYARVPGSVAAPTAGLHFTERLLNELREKGIRIAKLILHVGAGTFRPVKEEAHRMHREIYFIPPETAEAVAETRRLGRRVIAVGTTVVRAMESAWEGEGLRPGPGETELFIRPPYTFRALDALITNFHLPRSTLLMLVAAFAGRERILEAYRLAVREGYRFYSFGDAMLLLDSL